MLVFRGVGAFERVEGSGFTKERKQFLVLQMRGRRKGEQHEHHKQNILSFQMLFATGGANKKSSKTSDPRMKMLLED